MDHTSELVAREFYELALGNRVTLIALPEILEEKLVLKKDDVLIRALEIPESGENQNGKHPPGTLPFRHAA